MEENCEFSIMHTVCVFGNMLHKRIPARQPSLWLLCRYSQSSTEEVVCVVGNRASLSAPMSGFPYVSGEASPASECDCNETYSRANRSFCPSIPVLASQHSVPEVTLTCLVAKCVAAAGSLFLCLELGDGSGTPGSRGLYLAL